MFAWGFRAAGVDWVPLEPGGWYRCSGKVRCMLAMCYTVNQMCSGSISNCYNARPLSLTGQYREQANQITEALPPEVKVKDDLSLPPNINSYPFSSFIKSQFQVGIFLCLLIASPQERHTSSSNTRNKLYVCVLLFLCRKRISLPLVSLCSTP